jgi:TRAP-type C4-dicarboxylate transport system permease small subunit
MDDPERLRRLALQVNMPFGYGAAALVLLMMLTVIYDVVARLAFRAPTLWVIDVNEYMLVYLTFLPAAWILMKDGHIKVEIVVSRLGPRGRRLTAFVTDVIGLLYSVILAWQGWLVAWDAWQHDYRFSTALSAPQFPVFVIIPIGSAWLCLAFLARLWTAWNDGHRAIHEPGGS